MGAKEGKLLNYGKKAVDLLHKGKMGSKKSGSAKIVSGPKKSK